MKISSREKLKLCCVTEKIGGEGDDWVEFLGLLQMESFGIYIEILTLHDVVSQTNDQVVTINSSYPCKYFQGTVAGGGLITLKILIPSLNYTQDQ